MNKINLEELTPEQFESLKAQVTAKEKEKAEKRENEVLVYKDLVKGAVGDQIKALQIISDTLSLAKKNTFDTFVVLIEMKQKLFGTKEGQQSYSFSDDNGNQITIGYRVLDFYDDTLDAGIDLVRRYMDSLAIDKRSAQLVGYINQLLKKDMKGNLKPNRVIELQNMAEKENDEKLIKGVDIIRKSYKPKKSVLYIEASVLSNTGQKIKVPLSISSVDFPSDFSFDSELFK